MRKSPLRLGDVIVCGQQYALGRRSIGIEVKAVKIVSPNGIGFADYSQTAKGDAK